MHKISSFRWFYTAVSLLLLLAFCSNDLRAQRISEKNITIIAGDTSVLIDQFNTSNLVSINHQTPPQNITVFSNIANGQVKVSSTSAVKGLKKVTVVYELSTQTGSTTTNYRVYNINFVKSIVNVKDDMLSWDGNGTLDIDVKANDIASTATTIKINSSTGSAVIINGKIQYTNANFVGPDYIHYTLTDTYGSSDQGVVKIDAEQSDPTEDKTISFVVNYSSSKLVTLPDGFTVSSDPFNGSLSGQSANHFVYKPADYYIGQDSFEFQNTNGIAIKYLVNVIDAQRDPGIVKNDLFYTPVNTPVSFDVFKNDVIQNLSIDTFSQQLTHDSLGVFTFNATTAGLKNFFYEITTPIGTERGKIKVNVGNFTPDRDIKYDISMLGNVPFVMEYNVPISGYGFTLASAPSHGIVNIYTDSTTLTSCGITYGKAIITYTPDNGFTGADEYSLNYCINGTQCKVIKIFPNVVANPTNDCNCTDNCVWSGDLNGDGRVSGQDLLILGRYLGAQGPTRTSSTQSFWTGEAGQEWGVNTRAGNDLMHADANGDGFLTEEDAQSIADNFGKINNLVPKENLGYKDFPFELIAVPAEVDSGETQIIYFVLGSEAIPANGVHGISFGISNTNIDSASVAVDMYKNSWLTENAPSMSLWKQVKKGDVRIALTTMGGSPIVGEEEVDGLKIGGSSGSGVIGQMSIVGEEEVDGLRGNTYNLDYFTNQISASEIILEALNGEKYSLDPGTISLKINKKKKTTHEAGDYLFVYPNPTSNTLFIDNQFSIIHSVIIVNMLGNELVSNNNIESHSYNLDISTYAAGVYFVKVKTDMGVVTRKVVKR